MTHICVRKLTIIGSYDGLSSEWRQTIIWTNVRISLIGILKTNFTEIVSGIHIFSFKKMHLKTSFVKWRHFCLGLNAFSYFYLFIISYYAIFQKSQLSKSNFVSSVPWLLIRNSRCHICVIWQSKYLVQQVYFRVKIIWDEKKPPLHCLLIMKWYGIVADVMYHTVYPKKYAHGFVVLCFVVVMQSFIMNSYEVFIHIHQGCFADTGAIVRLPQCQWSKPDGYGKISQCLTTTKHSKAKTVCIFLGIYCIWCCGLWFVDSCKMNMKMKRMMILMMMMIMAWYGIWHDNLWWN